MPPRPARVVCLKCSGAAVPPAAQRANPCEVFSCVASRCERQAIYGWLCALPGDFEGSAIDLRRARLGDGLRKRSCANGQRKLSKKFSSYDMSALA
jgi:hypothetical protein